MTEKAIKFDLEKIMCVTSALFECKDCNKTFENYKNAQACGARHAKAKGHHVRGEVTLSINYYGV